MEPFHLEVRQLGRRVRSTDLGAPAGELLLMARAGAPRGLAVADSPEELPPLLGAQPRSIRVALVHHWAAPVTLLADLPPCRDTCQTPACPHTLAQSQLAIAGPTSYRMALMARRTTDTCHHRPRALLNGAFAGVALSQVCEQCSAVGTVTNSGLKQGHFCGGPGAYLILVGMAQALVMRHMRCHVCCCGEQLTALQRRL